MDRIEQKLDNKNKGSNMKCQNCGCEMEMDEMPEAKEEMPDIKSALLDDMISSVGSDDIGQKLEIIIAKKKKKPELEIESEM